MELTRKHWSLMRGTVMYGPGDVRVDDVPEPQILEPSDAIIRIVRACVCGSDLWPYRGVDAPDRPVAMGHEYVGIVEEVGGDISNVKPGQFVIGSESHDAGARITPQGHRYGESSQRLIDR